MKIKGVEEKNKVILILFVNILFCLCFFLWIREKSGFFVGLNDLHISLFPWVVTLIILQMLGYRIKKISFYDFGFWFLAISYIFMFGFLFRDVFNLETTLVWNPITFYSIKDLFNAYVFAIFSLESFSLAYLLFYKKKNAISKITITSIKSDKTMYNIGLILLLIGGIAKLINDAQIIIATQTANSYSAYTSAVSSGWWDDLACLVLPGIFFLIYSGYLKDNTKRVIFYVALIYYVAMMMLTGTRKVQIFSILSLFLGYDFSLEKRRLSIFRIVIYSVLALVLINIVIIIREYRFDLSTVIPMFVENIKTFNLFGNILGETFAETGITLLSVASIIKVVPAIMPFEYGMTFLRTIPSFLPIGWLAGDFFNKASSTYVINSYTKLSVGSSFIGDLYWNWGIVGGIIASFLFGTIVCKVMRIKKNRSVRYSFAMYFSLFSQLIILVRAEFFDAFRPMMMLIIFVFLINQLSSKRIRRQWDEE